MYMFKRAIWQCDYRLGEKEIQEMIDEDGKAEAHCHFCNQKYHYSKEELKVYLKESK